MSVTATETGSRAREFLDAYNDIEGHLRKHAGADTSVPMMTLVRESKLPVVQRHLSAFRAFAELRNAISHHSYMSGEPIAAPLRQTVDSILRLREQVLRPETVRSALTGTPITTTSDAQLIEPLRKMRESNLSQIPVYDDGAYVNLLTTNAIARWLADRLIEEDGDLLVENALVADVLGCLETFERARFATINTTVSEAIDMLSPAQGSKDLAPVALLVSQNGQKTESPLGILVPQDVPMLVRMTAID